MPTATRVSPVVTGKVRLSYAHLWEPYLFPGDAGDPKFSVVLLIPKSDTATMKKMRTAQQEALEVGKTKLGGKVPRDWKDTIHDGDEEADLEQNPEYAGHWYVTVSSKTRPGIVDENINPIMDQQEVYSGCYAKVSLDCSAYTYSGSKGVSFWLRNVMKIADGEPFGGVSRAEDDFGDDEDLI